ncbi:DUF6297 family protein [Actinomyces sp.]|uniref:DUF6297 family protein n=1 Tax=Actinomyces sp. TaxID=29317 RepID=UPI0026DC5BE4|nr:DUF6297 family protein [Actinomyces sp.]MDO4900875.1 DUF6297 family protein [Actinomyces sp.]
MTAAWGHSSQAPPPGRELRRWVRSHTASTHSPWAILGDLYDTVLSAAILAAMTVPYLTRLGARAPTSMPGPAVADPAWMVLLLALVLAGLALSPLRRLGPLFLRTHEASWWLTMPGDRRGLLDPVAWAEIAFAIAAGGTAGFLFAVVAGTTAVTAAGTVLLGGGGGALLLLALVHAQVGGAGLLGARLTLLAMAAAVVAAGALDTPFPRQTGEGVFTALGLFADLTAAVWWYRLRARLVDIPDSHLLEVAARNLGTQVSWLSLDTRALGRLLSAPARRPARPSRLPLAGLSRSLPRGLRPVLAVAQADWLLLWRQPRRPVQLLTGLVIALFPLTSSGIGSVGQAVFHLFGGWVAVLALAEPARRAWFDGVADASWPVGPVLVRCGHLLVPTAAMILWTALTVLAQLREQALPLTLTGACNIIALVAAAGCGWAGAALRSGFRPAPDFSLGLIASPVGSLPPGAVAMVVNGPDAAALAGAPTALLASGVPPTARLLLAQLAVSAIVVAWGLRTGRRSP